MEINALKMGEGAWKSMHSRWGRGHGNQCTQDGGGGMEINALKMGEGAWKLMQNIRRINSDE